jgi:uncharacterized protein YjgD (DUF1641 family)
MSSIIPPFDGLPKIPVVAINKVQTKLDESIDSLVTDCNRFIKSVTKLPKDCNCEDPRIKRAKLQLEKLQQQFTVIQGAISKVQDTASKIKQVITLANTARNTILFIQLTNPVTAAAFIAQQSLMIQDTIIVNALQSLNAFGSVPVTALSKMSTLVPAILQSIQTIGQVCNGDVEGLKVDNAILSNINRNPESELVAKNNNNLNNQTQDKIVNETLTRLNDTLPTDFYADVNVSESDLIDRASVIQEYTDQLNLVDTQLDLVIKLSNSIKEAPSEVIYGNGTPSPTVGKIGDYYIDNDSQLVYGPKLSMNNWTSNSIARDIQENIK